VGGLRKVRVASAPVGVFLFALAFSLPELAGVAQQGDEHGWIWEGQESWRRFREGRFDDPFWSEPRMLWGRQSPGVSKITFGLALQASGRTAPPFSLRERPWLEPDLLVAARRASAVVGALGVVFTWLFARRLAGGRAAAMAAVLLATSPIWLGASRRVTTDVHGAALAVGAVWLFARARESLLSGAAARRTVAEFAGAGLLSGLAVGSKFNVAAVPLLLGLVLLFDVVVGRRDARCVRTGILSAVLFGTCALVVFVGTYPYLWSKPLPRFLGVI
jgi:hypothetical protein